MSSSLERDYDEFKFSRENQLEEAKVEDTLQKLGNKSDPKEENQHRCDICDQKFSNKKDLQDHLTKHLGNPRVVLQRIVDQKFISTTVVKKDPIDNYWLGKEQKGNLKITLKRRSPVGGDSLKLTLKKSPKSEGFTVVSRNCGLIEESIEKQNALAEAQENDNKSDSEEEKTTEQTFENVMLNQENTYDDDNDNFESEPDHNPLESSERPLMDNVEGDSGVGSDSVHATEREEQNEEDGNSDKVELVGNEDPEESDALEATCRETIENLKKLGEHSRFIGSRSSDLLNPTETQAIEEEEEENNDVADNRRSSTVIEELRGNSEISIVPKSALMPEPSTSSPRGSETDIVPVSGSSSSSFSWNKITEDSNSSKSKDDEAAVKDTPDNSEAAGSLLQNFLIEHQRNQNESNLSSGTQNFETEYVSLERLAETVNTCRVCNEKFKDMAHLDTHRSKAGHYQCSVPDCSALVFTNSEAVAIHKSQAHGAPMSPGITVSPRRLASNSPQASNSPSLNQTSPRTNTRSPHSPSFSVLPRRHSPHTSSPTYNIPGASTSHVPSTHAPVPGLEHLTAPMQQLAQQVQRINMPPSMHISAPGSGLLQGSAGYFQGPGRPPMYRNSINFPPAMMQMYQQYAANQYQMQCQAPLQPPTPQQVTRGRYPGVVPGQRPPRMPTMPPVPINNMQQRTRAKRPMVPPSSQLQQQVQQQLQQTTTSGASLPKQRRMDVLIPDRNEDADCHVIAQQKRNDGLPVIQNVQGGATLQPSTSNDSTIHLTDQITLSVRQPGPNPAQVNAMVQGAKKPDASSVANVLASRGITVTPATNNKKSQEQPQPGPSGMQQQPQKSQQQQSQQQQSQQQQPQQQQRSLNVPALNLNSAISIIPTASAQKRQQEQQVQFAVPQSRQVTNEVERPPRPPTVDLTQDPAPQVLTPTRRGRPPNLPNPNQYSAANRMHASLTCQVCDKRFQSQELLAQHMATHRQSNKLIYKCGLGACTAAYPSVAALNAHRRSFHARDSIIHPEPASQQNGNVELALPVVDLQSPSTLTRLSNLGIQSYIPLSQLSAQTNGCYGLPIISIDGARNSAVSNLAALGATSILSIGPLRHLSNR